MIFKLRSYINSMYGICELSLLWCVAQKFGKRRHYCRRSKQSFALRELVGIDVATPHAMLSDVRCGL